MALTKKATLVLSSPMEVDLELYKGDTGKFRVTFKNENGTPINVSTATWDADIRVNAADAATVASFTVTPVGGDTSSIDVSLTNVLSATLPLGNLFYDLQMTLAGVVTTLIYGAVIVKQDVSRV